MKELADRFWPKVQKSDGCWLWIGWLFPNGYGCFREGGTKHRRKLLAHRVVYELTKGPIPEGAVIMHTCDVRACCNPDHLRASSQLENMADCAAKGRQGDHRPRNPARGESAYSAKLTEDQIVAMRVEYESGQATHAELADRYKVRRSTISKIIRGERWAHLPLLPYRRRRGEQIHPGSGESHSQHKLTNEQVQAIRTAEGTQQAIADRYGISRSHVSGIKSGRFWTTLPPEHEGTPAPLLS